MRMWLTHAVAIAQNDDADPWHLANAALYRVCEEHPRHTDRRAVIAKVWLIGRAYAAALERRKRTSGRAFVRGDEFYEKDVSAALTDGELDRHLRGIPPSADVAEVWEDALVTHAHLVSVFRKLTGDGRRSLASKYLHFHRPAVFFIYDSRAAFALGRLVPRKSGRVRRCPTVADPDYGRFVVRALDLRDELEANFGCRLSPRQLDRLLLKFADRRR